MLQVAGRMKQANLSEIMGFMSSESARKLTKGLMDSKKVPDDVLQKAAASPAPAKAG